ncbi:MAG: S26 family signal peptidase [Actinomycetales bacterium]
MNLRRFWPIRLARISGESMAPTYKSGELVLVRLFRKSTPNISLDEVVLIEREMMPGIFFIKRVTKIQGDSYWVAGDNADPEIQSRMNDSRTWGLITKDEIKGRLFFSRKIKKTEN